MRRVMRELAELRRNPPEGIRVQTNEQDMMDVTGIIQGPGEHIPRFKFAIPMADPFRREQRVRLMPAATSGSGSSLQTSFLLHLPNVSRILCRYLFPLTTFGRLVCNEDFPSQRLQFWRDLCEHAQKGLEINIWHWPYSRHR